MVITDIFQTANKGENFREVLFTGEHSQLVLMSLNVGEDIGMEVHPNNDQILLITDGQGEAIVGEETTELKPCDVVLVPAGTQHNIINRGQDKLKLVTVYGPADHKPGTVHPTKEDALKDEGTDHQ